MFKSEDSGCAGSNISILKRLRVLFSVKVGVRCCMEEEVRIWPGVGRLTCLCLHVLKEGKGGLRHSFSEKERRKAF